MNAIEERVLIDLYNRFDADYERSVKKLEQTDDISDHIDVYRDFCKRNALQEVLLLLNIRS